MLGASAPAVRAFDALLPARRRLVERDPEIVETQIALAEISAPTGGERRRAHWVQERLIVLGLGPTIDTAGNVIARRPGTRNEDPVVVCAHLDTVFDAATPVGVERLRDRLSGPGIGDNARGLAGMLAIAESLGAAGVRTRRPILFAATTGEEGEGDLRGARHLFATAASAAHAAIALDGAGDERVVTHALGIRRYRIRFAGPGGHSWASFGVANAIHAATALGAELARLRIADQPRTSLTVSRMGGGSAVNAIPSDAWLEIDVRSTSAAELTRLDREIRHAARTALDVENARRRPDSPALAIRVEVIGDRPGGPPADDTFLVDAAFEATRLVGRTPDAAVASTDANVPLSLGIPAVAIGAGGRGGDTHTTREWFENRDGTLGLARAMTILVAAAGLP